MDRLALRLGASVASVMLSMMCSCGGASVTESPDGESEGDGGDIDGAVADSGAPGDAASDSVDPFASRVRLAHAVPGVSAVDVCVRLQGSTGNYAGPLAANKTSLAGGVSYAQLTGYLPLTAGAYDVRLVAGGSSDCQTPLAGADDVTDLPAFGVGNVVTLVAAPKAGAQVGVWAYADEVDAPAGKGRLRFIQETSFAASVNFGMGSGAHFQSLFSGVGSHQSGSVPGSATGYLDTAPLSHQLLSMRASSGPPDALLLDSVNLPVGAVVTVFSVGTAGDPATPLRALICIDNADAVNGLAACSLSGTDVSAVGLAHFRIAHLSPDAPRLDLCLKSSLETGFSGTPLLERLGLSDGIGYGEVSRYLDVPYPNGFTYNTRVILATDDDCATAPVVQGARGSLGSPLGIRADSYTTVAVTGDNAIPPGSSEPGLAFNYVWTDSASVPSNKYALRFIHASPGTAGLHAGSVLANTLVDQFRVAAYGATATPLKSSDANHYFVTDPVRNFRLGASLTTAGTPLVSVPGLTWGSGDILTAVAVGAERGDAAHPLQLLLCSDSAVPVGGLSTCNLLP